MFVHRCLSLFLAAALAALTGACAGEPARPETPTEPGKAEQPPEPAKADKPAESAKPDKPAESTRSDKAEVRKNAHDLLVGVTFYEHLPESRHLVGPGNDVEMMYTVLTEKFHFSPDQIVKLSEKEGKDKGKDFLPTKANIKREWARLAQVAKEGDYVLIHMGGHGSQQPEDPPAKAKLFGDPALVSEPEPDGLDEIFLPRDVGKWEGGSGTVQNAIIDDEVANWLKAIRGKKASVWIIFDSCHSGTMSRGGDDTEKTRDLDMEKDLGVKPEAIKKAVDAAEAREKAKGEKARGGPPPSPFKLAENGGLVAIYAAQNIEVTLEREMPPMSKSGKVYGLLSYTIAQVLMEASEKSPQQMITYAELARRVQAQYVAWGRSFPTPLIEGEDKDREILGDKIWPGRSSIQLSVKGDGLKINAGAIHGLTPDSILSVARPAGKGKDELGYVKVTEARPFDSDVEPCDKDGKDAKTEFPNAAVCEKYFIAAGDQRIRVAVDPIDEKGQRMPAEYEKLLRESLKTVEKESAVVQAVEKLQEADWLIRRQSDTEDRIILVPAAGWSIRSKQPGAESSVNKEAESDALGPAEAKEKSHAVAWLAATLEAINRAETVKRLGATGGSEGSDRGIKVKVEVVRYKSRTDRKDPIPLTWEGGQLPVYANDYLGLRLSNPGRSPIDVTVLFVSSKYGIEPLFPVSGDLNRLQPNESLLLPGFFKPNDKSSGLEHIVVLAVKAQGQPVDFGVLKQKDLEVAGKRDLPKPIPKDALACPVGQLLRRAAAGEGNSRGLTREEVEDYAAAIFPLQTHNEKRPKESPKK